MIKNVLNQFECKNANAGDILYNTDNLGNVLLFVSAGKLMICNKASTPLTEVEEGYFVLLPEGECHIAKAVTTVRTILMHAGPLSDFITEDPEWHPENPVVLPIFPSLAHTLNLIEFYEQEKRRSLN
ncbi:hypothetical protein [Parabacteroides sp. AM08-6]|uniref:hypothetical protein n=1 Tax=Parabacteroides sp. AM08-6 TaxID=2292053 RepID=UPI000EFFCB14|nr:hypothetical protein [Parabacteroides sp. AM08-6]RHJ83010.1 hypothetical protein DW103_08715 [Parabacteroides sp. AM08-6]